MTTASASAAPRHRPRPSHRRGLCLCLCAGLFLSFYSILLLLQYRSWGAVPDGSLWSPSEQNNVTSARRGHDHLLAKYNLPAPEQFAKVKVPDAKRAMAFLHIGKTGGSTISMHLRNGCHASYLSRCKNRGDGWTPNETVASHRIESYHHMEYIVPERLANLTTIVTTVRNPISRFLSAFAYGHPTNMVATDLRMNMTAMQKYTCFPSISYLVKAGMGQAGIPWNKAYLLHLRQLETRRGKVGSAVYGKKAVGTSKTEDILQINCTELARIAFGLNESWAFVNASHPWTNHMTFDYRQYYRSMPSDKELIVMRHEHLWADWAKVNRMLSGENDAYQNWPDVPPFREIQRNVSRGYVMKKRWKTETAQEQSWLCELLHDEIRKYLMIVIRAVNLEEGDFWEAADDIERQCNI